MDIESDDSERWEDFFGSSTELAPSLLGIYDTLTCALDASHNNSSSTTNTCSSTTTSSSSSNNSSSRNDDSHNGVGHSNTSISNISSGSRSNSNSNSNVSRISSLSGEYALLQQQQSANNEDEHDVLESPKLLPLDAETSSNDSSNNNHSRASSSLTLTSTTCHSLSSLAPTNSSNGTNNSSSSSTSSSNSEQPNKSRESTPTASASNKHRNNIRILSPNVQRIITHSDAEPVDSVDIDALQQQPHHNHLQSPVPSPVPQHRFVKKSVSGGGTTLTNGHKVKLSHIPLSKITGKLTQSGSDLVETFDSSSEYLDALSYTTTTTHTNEKKNKSVKKPSTPAVFPIPGVDDDKTPTNNGSPFNFEPRKLTLPKYDSQQSIKLIEMEQLATTTQLLTASSNSPKEFVAVTEPSLSPSEIVEAINFSLISQNLEKLSLNDQSNDSLKAGTPLLIEAINKPLISKPLVRSSSAACASTVAGSPLLTYARSKSLAIKANTIGGPVPIKLPTAQQLEELEEASKMSAESLDRLTDIKSKFSPKESRKISGLMLPEIAKLKHRPLSSSSICSTSSSSSSGSDQLNGKLATSYLASVESLADPSENELMDPHTGMSVFERACLEIVESERSYVEDLGQVIRGYLLDWKERACLRYDELRILFSNIEDIYDFNSTLLKQLINSGMDPVKIAKCFVDLRERFDVYTTYCTSYPEAISLLTKLLQATHTNALLTSTQKMLQQTLPLGSFLLKPVQRILKYHLLLDNLRKHCDVKEVFQAYEIMRQVARNIDQVKRKLEQQSRVKELSGILDGWLGPELTVLGELRQEGLLMEHNKPRMVFLFGTMLIITKPKEDSRLQFKSYIHQNNLMLSEHLPGEPTSFYVIPYDEPRNQIKLTAKNRDQKRLWAQHIKGVILEKFDNIPNRAKELVYKLGDEEDRTPDKNTWKWSLHSTSSTPVYLERRNQYRRSEIRNRSKLKRKTVTNSTSFDSFNEMAEVGKDSSASTTTIKPTKPISRNNSMDDNMLPALQKLAAAVKLKTKPEITSTTETDGKSMDANDNDLECKCEIATPDDNCTCILRDQRSSVRNSVQSKSPFFGGKALKERSKSVPRISFQIEEELAEERHSLHGSNTNLDARKSKSSKSVEIKQYNHKTMPKRIATLKKQRHSKKETSKFYMNLNDEFEETTQTVLKITESTENLLEKKDIIELAVECKETTSLPDVVDLNCEPNESLTPAQKAKKDAQIILDLLKNNKEFEKIYNKPQKKRTTENGVSVPTSPEAQNDQRTVMNDLPPRPPSRSPPPLEVESEPLNGSTPTKDEYEEPIYESLLRNVHVPYKFSPILGRSKSAATQYYKPRDKKSISVAARPESDYVTLIYSPEGALQQVGNDMVTRVEHTVTHMEDSASSQQPSRNSCASSSSSSTSTLKRDSQTTVISVEIQDSNSSSSSSSSSSSGNVSQASSAASTTEAIYARPMPKNLMMRLLSVNSSKYSLDNVSNSESSLLPRARKSIDNITLAFGRSHNKPPERRVSDVTEMCRQSILHRQGSEAVGERMAHVDYADPKTLFSVAHSSEASLQRDSVFSLTSSNDSVCDHHHQRRSAGTTELSTNFEYEDDYEACLEQDFRDSAIYSDDNDKRCDYESGDCVKRPTSPPPPPPPARLYRQHPQVPPKPVRIPPLTGLRSPVRSPIGEVGPVVLTPGGGVIFCPPHLSQAASRSWVLQQIDNFNK